MIQELLTAKIAKKNRKDRKETGQSAGQSHQACAIPLLPTLRLSSLAAGLASGDHHPDRMTNVTRVLDPKSR